MKNGETDGMSRLRLSMGWKHGEFNEDPAGPIIQVESLNDFAY